MKWGAVYSPSGSGFGYLSFTVLRDAGKDYPDIGYGMEVTLRKGLTKILFHGVITKIQEERGDASKISVGCTGWKVVFENDRLNRIYTDSRTESGAWIVDEEPSGLFQPSKFDIRLGSEIEVRPRERIDFTADEYSEAVYSMPSGQNVKWVEFSWATVFPSGYPFKFEILSNDNTLLTTTTTGEQSGSSRAVISGDATTVSIRLTITDAGESTAADDAAYAKITAVSISAKDTYPVDMAVVLKDIVDYLYDAGHGISNDKTKIESTNRTLHPAYFLSDQTPREILEWCANRGNSNGKPVCWGMELNDRRRVFLKEQDLETVGYYLPHDEAKTNVTGDAQNSHQKLYATYKGIDGEEYRTADTTDQDTIDDMNGYFRRDVMGLDGEMSSGLANFAVALNLSENKKPTTSSSWEVKGSILSNTGKRVPFDEILPGVMVTDRNFKSREAILQGGDDFRDRATTFFLIGTEIDYDSGVCQLINGRDDKTLSRYMMAIADMP